MPTFRNSWLYTFQAREVVKCRTLHGEEGDVPRKTYYYKINTIRAALHTYEPHDIFKYNKTGPY